MSYSEVVGNHWWTLRQRGRWCSRVLSIRGAAGVTTLCAFLASSLPLKKLVDETFVLVRLIVWGSLQGLWLIHGASSLQGPRDFCSDAEQLLQARDLLDLGLGGHDRLQPGGAQGSRSTRQALLDSTLWHWHAGALRDHRDVMNHVQPL